MDHADQDLQQLITTGKAQGYLTYDQVNAYLPDEAVNPDKLDNLLIALEDMGIEIVADAPAPAPKPVKLAPGKKPALAQQQMLDFDEDARRSTTARAGAKTRFGCISRKCRRFRCSRVSRKSRWPRRSKSRGSAFVEVCSAASLQ